MTIKNKEFNLDYFLNNFSNDTGCISFDPNNKNVLFFEALINKDDDKLINVLNQEDFNLSQTIPLGMLPKSFKKAFMKMGGNKIKNSVKKYHANFDIEDRNFDRMVKIPKGLIMFLFNKNINIIASNYNKSFHPGDFEIRLNRLQNQISNHERPMPNFLINRPFNHAAHFIFYNNVDLIQDFVFDNKFFDQSMSHELLNQYKIQLFDNMDHYYPEQSINRFVESFEQELSNGYYHDVHEYNRLDGKKKEIYEKYHLLETYFKQSIKQQDFKTSEKILNCFKQDKNFNDTFNNNYLHLIEIQNNDFNQFFNFIHNYDKENMSFILDKTFKSIKSPKSYNRFKNMMTNENFKNDFLALYQDRIIETNMNPYKLQIALDYDLNIDSDQIKKKTKNIKGLMKAENKKKDNLVNFYKKLFQSRPTTFKNCIDDSTYKKINEKKNNAQDDQLSKIFEHYLLSIPATSENDLKTSKSNRKKTKHNML